MKNKENKRTRFKYNRKKIMIMNSQFVPVKITNKMWADKLMAGEIFMRPLKAFASYETTNVVNNLDKYRGDPYEGISSLSFDVEHDKVAPLIDEDHYTKAQLNQSKASNGSIRRIELVRVYNE